MEQGQVRHFTVLMEVAIHPFLIYFQQRLNPKAIVRKGQKFFSPFLIARPGGHALVHEPKLIKIKGTAELKHFIGKPRINSKHLVQTNSFLVCSFLAAMPGTSEVL